MLTCTRLFYLFVMKFSSFDFLQSLPGAGPDGLDNKFEQYGSEDDIDQCLYYLRTLSNMLRWSSESMWAALADNNISTEKAAHPSLHRISMFMSKFSWYFSNVNSWPGWRHATS